MQAAQARFGRLESSSRTHASTLASSSSPSSQAPQTFPPSTSRASLVTHASSRPAPLFQDRDNEAQFDYGGARGLVAFLCDHFTLFQRELTTLSTRLTHMEKLLVPLLAFGEHSPYNPDANATAKKLLAGFIFFPSDKQLVDAFPESLQGLLALKSAQDIYTTAVRFFNEREVRKTNKERNQLLLAFVFFRCTRSCLDSATS